MMVNKGLTRRNFLKVSGTIGIGLMPQSGWGATGGALMALSKRVYKIGLLLPDAMHHATLGDQYLAGLRLALQNTNLSPAITIEKTGISTSDVLQKALHLIDRDRVDVLVGFTGAQALPALEVLADKRQIPMFISDAGANLPVARIDSPLMQHHSLNLWAANWLLGGWAASELGGRGLMVASHYESGFDAYNAFRAGFEAGGGSVIKTVITHIPASPEPNLMREIRQSQPDFVFAAYADQKAVDFWSSYDADLPLIGSGMMIDADVLRQIEGRAGGFRTVLNWSTAAAGYQAFARAYHQQYGQEPGYFALPGYEAGQALTVHSEMGALRDGHFYLSEVAADGAILPITALHGDPDLDRIQSYVHSRLINPYPCL